ncbi:MAG: hypothetical protein HZC28_20655 [Spirochaetes bacterium]|nr:hypothetical protein [Spirochaetota bacterium]
MDLSKFPRYTEYDPKVPVWCVTPETGGCIHRFFDTSPISPSGRYLAVFRMPFEDRQPAPGDAGDIIVIDLETGKEKVVAQSCGWEPQMGANINWGSTDNALYFNDVDTTAAWKPFAWKLDPLTGKREKMEGTVYHASADGRWLISANMTTMRKTQPGYGVRVPDEHVRWNKGAVDDDGFYITDTSTGKTRLFASIRSLLSRANPQVQIDDLSNVEIYGFHSKFNPQSDRLMLSLRWFPMKDEPQWDLFRTGHNDVRFAWVTIGLDGSDVHCAVGPEQWVKGGHHGTWFPDGKRISMNLNIDRDVMRLVQVNADGSDLHKMRDDVIGSGHPTVHPDVSYVLTDTYTFEKVSYNDGTIPLRWISLDDGSEKHIVRIQTKPLAADGVLRIDPHPAWDRTWRYVTFNGFVGGTRRVYIADMESLLKK